MGVERNQWFAVQQPNLKLAAKPDFCGWSVRVVRFLRNRNPRLGWRKITSTGGGAATFKINSMQQHQRRVSEGVPILTKNFDHMSELNVGRLMSR